MDLQEHQHEEALSGPPPLEFCTPRRPFWWQFPATPSPTNRSYGRDTNEDRITIEWTYTPDGAAKEFRHEWFQDDDMVRSLDLPIEYNP